MTRTLALGGAAIAAALLTGSADAQTAACGALVTAQSCLCTVPIGGGAPGLLTSATGNVVVSGPASFAPAGGAGGSLNLGAGINVGPGGNVTINFGPSCQNLSLGPGAFSICQIGGNACLRSQATIPPRTTATAVAVTGTAIAGFIMQQQNEKHEDKPLSP